MQGRNFITKFWTLIFTILLTIIGESQLWSQLPPLPPSIVLDTNSKDMVKLIYSERGTIIRDGNNTINIVVGDVAFEHNGDYLYADSARLNLTTNTVYAYGDVGVTQTDGTTAYADRLFYNGKTSVVELIGNVELASGGDFLWADKATYNLKTQIGSYANNGTLQSGNTVVSSKQAVYNVKTKNARFKQNVIVLDPEYQVNSQDLNYNTDTRLVTFYAPSVIQNDSATLFTQSGTYDAAGEIATFDKRSTIVTQGQYMTANSMKYNRSTGLGIGKGDVVAIDSAKDITMWGDLGTVNELTKQVMVTKNPYLRMIKDSTAMYIKADTFYSEQVATLNKFRDKSFTEEDSILLAYDLLQRAAAQGKLADTAEVNRLDSLKNNKIVDSINIINSIDSSTKFDNNKNTIDSSITIEKNDTSIIDYRTKEIYEFIDSIISKDININNFDDTLAPISNVGIAQDSLTFDGRPILAGTQAEVVTPRDTSELRYIVAYRNVLVYSDSAQAKCDSLSYSQLDSVMQLFYNPVIWTRNGQVIGNTIIAKVDSNYIKWIKVPQNGIMINQAFTTNSVMFDQIQGNQLMAHFSNNEVDSVIARGSSSTIYYAKDESDALIGVSSATANDIHIRFNSDSTNKRRIKEIAYYQDFEQTMHPISKIDIDDMKLPRFNWRGDERPKSLGDFLDAIEKDKSKVASDLKINNESKDKNISTSKKKKSTKSKTRK